MLTHNSATMSTKTCCLVANLSIKATALPVLVKATGGV